MLFRMIFGLPGAAIVTALLFLAMGWMVRTQEPAIGDPPPRIPSILPEIDETGPVAPPKIDRKQIPAPEPVEIDRAPRSEKPGGISWTDALPGPTGGESGIDISFTGTRPTIIIPPSYPENCRARGAQGVVMVEFDVTPDGTVVNPRVIASENSCLDRAALQTIQKWKFTPKQDSSGRPVPQRGLRQTFNYQLTDA